MLLVGAGGLGCSVGALLAGAGIGSIHVIDHDEIEVSNLNRQILFREADIGSSKAETAAREMAAINSDIRITHNTARLSLANVAELTEQVDLVIDAADNFATSYILSDQCVNLAKPLLSASVNKSYGFVGGFCADFNASRPSFRALFPKLPKQQTSCDLVGVTGPSVGVIASVQAQEAIKMLINDKAALFSKVLYLNLWNYSMHTVDFSDAQEPINSSASLIRAADLTAQDYLLDVRSHEETATKPQAFPVNQCIPLEELLEGSAAQVNIEQDLNLDHGRIVTACQSGQRALIAAQLLNDAGFKNVATLIPDD